MSRIAVPDDLIGELQEVLGTNGKRETVIRALKEVLATESRRVVAEQIRTLKGLDLDDPDVMAGAWR